jgi:hypothetical protein
MEWEVHGEVTKVWGTKQKLKNAGRLGRPQMHLHAEVSTTFFHVRMLIPIEGAQ